VEGSDGTAFIVDDDTRAEIAISSSESVTDPDIFKGPTGYILLLSRGQSVQALSAEHLRGLYTSIPGLPEGMLVREAGGVPAGYYDATGDEYWIYVHSFQGNKLVIRRAGHDRMDTPIPDASFSTVITGDNFPGLGSSTFVESPGFAFNSPGLSR
jgi:hypothetical protein